MKYFIVSDIHSFLTPLKTALKSAGYDKKNKNHCLIINGDIFDRGDDTVDLYKYISSIPKSRRILIRGNHDSCYKELLTKSFPEKYDFSNGTVTTFCAVADMKEAGLHAPYYLEAFIGDKFNFTYASRKMKEYWAGIVAKVKNSEITKWLFSDEWVNYFEIDKYIITHSFIPVQLKKPSAANFSAYYPTWQCPVELLTPISDWRELQADAVAWDDARWGCPYRQFDAGLFDLEKKNGKVLVCGHWHASDFHNRYEHDIIDPNNCHIYYGKNLIATDGCTAATGYCNVLVIDENFNCFDQFQKPLATSQTIIGTFPAKES